MNQDVAPENVIQLPFLDVAPENVIQLPFLGLLSVLRKSKSCLLLAIEEPRHQYRDKKTNLKTELVT